MGFAPHELDDEQPRMKLLKNYGTERLVDELNGFVRPGATLDICSPALSLFAFDELRATLKLASACRLITTAPKVGSSLLGTDADRVFRNRLQARWLAREAAAWCASIALRETAAPMPQGVVIATLPEAQQAFFGACALTTDGIGLTPSNQIRPHSNR